MSIFVINNGKMTSVKNERQLTGEKIPGDLNSWMQYSTDPNIILKYSYGLLSERASTLFHTHPPISAAIEKQTSYAIGKGLIFRSQPDWETLKITKEYAKEWSSRFQKLIHYSFELLNFYEKQSTIFRTGMVQGDSLLLFDRKDPIEGLPFDLIETGGDQINWAIPDDSKKESDDKIVLGIKTDKYLRKKGVYLNDNKEAIPFKDENGFQNIIQFYEKKLARQIRGYPLPYKIISAAKNNDRYWDAILNRAALEAMVLGIEKSDEQDINEQMESLAKQTLDDNVKANPGNAISKKGNVNELGGGNILSYSAKGDFSFLEMKTPSNNFDKLQNAYIELVGMGTDTPPEVVKSMYSTSYTAHKGAFNDFIKSYTKKRHTFEKNVCQPTVMELAKFFFVSGLIEMPNKQFFTNPIIQLATIAGYYLGPIPGQINPLQEVKAKVEEVGNAFKLRSDVAIESGNEFDSMITEWTEQEKQWQAGTPEQKANAIMEDFENDQNSDDDKNDDGSNKDGSSNDDKNKDDGDSK